MEVYEKKLSEEGVFAETVKINIVDLLEINPVQFW